ncbi:multiple inositol polyphosphate phosphatase 1 [Bicyclus anynana]|uniref:Multiple inositol polyphosphate phosphatase 1 n=1 Tax=Bicyclus anynana TaxID=110368 RepID=A0A6J1P7X3_BICAN|nr:multiple inositol polyphosphate phosphatase 1 [Bicyclus anynana]XP_023953833.1 multiple inositol polyphosphate phosphatase 1 [Bicyclus anynana]XP_023953837.1 multiple inositol polyphosphate phosphatase 1 [Bicyclus anynana]XP_052741378.1 multiple inositol polyphosphate phosphatase 1 [Bicyclus anynana]
MSRLVLVLVLFSVVIVRGSVCSECYWNSKCSYELFATATPYDNIRGDLRDHAQDNDCKVISLWSLHRHGNRNPGVDVTRDVKELQHKIKLLLDVPDNRRSNNCYQDMDDLMKWRWNTTLENSTSYLTGVGYEELYQLGRRILMRYHDFVKSVDNAYFRATNSQRTEVSLAAYVRGLSDGDDTLNFTTAIDAPLQRDDVIRPYETCARYQDEVKNGQKVTEELAAYDTSAEFLAIRDRVQAKMFVDYKISSREVFTLYELCRFERSWDPKLRSPWCSFFTDQDLVVLEYRDDIRHYYRNGYGSQINLDLGAQAMKNLYETFVAASKSEQTTMVSYFTHDTMLEMVYCALGLFRDREPLKGSTRKANRLWRSTEFTAFASNFIAVLYRCSKSDEEELRVQFLINEKPTALCPEDGCAWQQFLNTFQVFSTAKLDFCGTNESGASHLSGRSDMKMNLASSLMILVMITSIL